MKAIYHIMCSLTDRYVNYGLLAVMSMIKAGFSPGDIVISMDDTVEHRQNEFVDLGVSIHKIKPGIGQRVWIYDEVFSKFDVDVLVNIDADTFFANRVDIVSDIELCDSISCYMEGNPWSAFESRSMQYCPGYSCLPDDVSGFNRLRRSMYYTTGIDFDNFTDWMKKTDMNWIFGAFLIINKRFTTSKFWIRALQYGSFSWCDESSLMFACYAEGIKPKPLLNFPTFDKPLSTESKDMAHYGGNINKELSEGFITSKLEEWGLHAS